MTSGNAELEKVLLNLELVLTSKHIAAAFEEAYRCMNQLDIDLHPQETVGTLAFTIKHKCKMNHLRWSEMSDDF